MDPHAYFHAAVAGQGDRQTAAQTSGDKLRCRADKHAESKDSGTAIERVFQLTSGRQQSREK
jgi:hypothetical protein